MARRMKMPYIPLTRAWTLPVWLGLCEYAGGWWVPVSFAALDKISGCTAEALFGLPSVRMVAKLSARAWITSRQVTARKMYTLALRSAVLWFRSAWVVAFAASTWCR